MRIVHDIEEMRATAERARAEGKVVGLVPTMGALHSGHIELARRAREECGVVIMSIFVNPIQFGPNEDYEAYPRTLKADAELAEKAGVDYIFAPEAKQMYPREPLTSVDVGKLTDHLCGASRPGHFRGVATVVTKLFNIVRPHRAYFGMKDAQQLRVLIRMNEDLNFGIVIVPVPTVREADGLAISSRNAYLGREDRLRAVVLSRSLKLAERSVAGGERDAGKIKSAMRDLIMSEVPDASIDYIEVVDDDTVQPIERIDGKALIALAVRIGGTRLIDNVTVKV
ncbi:MAG TPA: pantoate--beta-alanine ligase [Bacillota bacterium]|nr:pantoate--beta-alanine ligase [Bacillota bacterium]HOH09434.1 pantoate--beta-alanine ligase [Bacillota bacterium]HOS49949.1 pantoate--beta-alanine ligase [Bacillota bacterium]HOY89020.1 pantoate--beta-alanine ligase [Bacillota bacterium]HPI00985.1 pantoate--beta-alanine ligase [Bacillota bacterium]